MRYLLFKDEDLFSMIIDVIQQNLVSNINETNKLQPVSLNQDLLTGCGLCYDGPEGSPRTSSFYALPVHEFYKNWNCQRVNGPEGSNYTLRTSEIFFWGKVFFGSSARLNAFWSIERCRVTLNELNFTSYSAYGLNMDFHEFRRLVSSCLLIEELFWVEKVRVIQNKSYVELFRVDRI